MDEMTMVNERMATPCDAVGHLAIWQGAMCVAYTAMLNGKQVVLKTPLPDTSHVEVAANDLEVSLWHGRPSRPPRWTS